MYHALADRVGTPLLCALDPEDAHDVALQLLALGVAPVDDTVRPRLATTVLGMNFRSPIGLAAGFDKQARVLHPCFKLGLGYVEVGGVTPLPQPGNPKPRLFRLPQDGAIINRFGLNSDGAAAVAQRLEAAAASWTPAGCVVGVNLAPSTAHVGDPAAAAADCTRLVAQLGPWVDVLVLNVSCPNVGRASAAPGDEAARKSHELELETLVAAVVRARDNLPPRVHGAPALAEPRPAAVANRPAARSARPALLLKVSPDLDAAGRAHVASLWYIGCCELAVLPSKSRPRRSCSLCHNLRCFFLKII
jgi:dihydroorotate dehydrogenase